MSNLDAIRQRVDAARKRWVPGTPERYPLTPGVLTLLEEERLLAITEAAERALQEIERAVTKPNRAITNEWYWGAQLEVLDLARRARAALAAVDATASVEAKEPTT